MPEMTACFRKYANAPYAILSCQKKRLKNSMAVAQVLVSGGLILHWRSAA